MSKMCPYIGIKQVSKLTLLLVGSPSVFYVLVFVFRSNISRCGGRRGLHGGGKTASHSAGGHRYSQRPYILTFTMGATGLVIALLIH